MAHNGNKKTKSFGGRNCKSQSGKQRDNWRIHRLNAAKRKARRLARRKELRGGFATKRAMLRFARFGPSKGER